MIPRPTIALADLATRIVTHIAPQLTSKFAQADSALISGLLLTMAHDYENGVYNRMADIDEVKELFNLAITQGAEHPTVNLEKLREFIGQTPESLRLADVTCFHAQGFELLISLHTWAEQHDENLNLEIWRFLRRHAERNKFDTVGP